MLIEKGGPILREDIGRLLQELLCNGTAFPSSLNISTSKRVRQGDTVPPKLFTSALQWVMKSLDWNKIGIRVDGIFLIFVWRTTLFSS
ncbi:unnamed protein product [Strongylus vulgaris]|uniref:Reverse transcriptase domain-containing protein n=1 Tax=Strongylus vulgaris TaxID=40348 RepID=A0A3P7JC71_STRVU|nr:unnamed protein product [Strongylus vulgaris]